MKQWGKLNYNQHPKKPLLQTQRVKIIGIGIVIGISILIIFEIEQIFYDLMQTKIMRSNIG